jgi:hypothetical protein
MNVTPSLESPGLTAEELLSAVNACGSLAMPVTHKKLHRWEQHGLFQGPRRYSQSGVRGSKQLYSLDAPRQLMETARAVQRFSDLDFAAWRLFCTDDFVPVGRIVKLLHRKVDVLFRLKRLLEGLDRDESQIWEWGKGWERARAQNRIDGAIRRSFRNEGLRFVLILLEFAAGTVEFHEYAGNAPLFQKYVAPDKRIDDEDLWNDFKRIASSVGPVNTGAKIHHRIGVKLHHLD